MVAHFDGLFDELLLLLLVENVVARLHVHEARRLASSLRVESRRSSDGSEACATI